MADKPFRVPYRFTPVPHAVSDALTARLINQTEQAVLVALYRRADRRSQVRLTLAQLAERLAWTKSEDWLSKILRSLRTNGWLSYEAVPGARGQVYVFTLRHAGHRESEQGPEETAARAPRLVSSNHEAGPSTGPPPRADNSETQRAASESPRPQPTQLSPRRRPDEVAANELDYWKDALERVRRLENVREKAKAACEGDASLPASQPTRSKGPRGQHVELTPRQVSLFEDSTDEGRSDSDHQQGRLDAKRSSTGSGSPAK